MKQEAIKLGEPLYVLPSTCTALCFCQISGSQQADLCESHAVVLFWFLCWLMEQHDAFLWLIGANESVEGQRAALECVLLLLLPQQQHTPWSVFDCMIRLSLSPPCFSAFNEAGLCLRSTCCSRLSRTACQVAGTRLKVSETAQKTGRQRNVLITILRWKFLFNGWYCNTCDSQLKPLAHSHTFIEFISCLHRCVPCGVLQWNWHKVFSQQVAYIVTRWTMAV